MMVKRLGPSLVPAEVVVPLASLGDVMAEIDRKVNQPIVKEGIVIRESLNGKPEVVILGFIPSDQRKFSYNFVFRLALTIMKIAVRSTAGGPMLPACISPARPTRSSELSGPEDEGIQKEDRSQ